MLRDDLTKYMDKGDGEKKSGLIKGDVNLVFNGVYFKYPNGEKNAVKDICFELKRGKIIAFVGNSGSGKSTIASLLAGFYRPHKGEIILIELNVRSNSKAKSLSVFMKKFTVKKAYRITENNFQTKKDIRYIPIYSTFCFNDNN